MNEQFDAGRGQVAVAVVGSANLDLVIQLPVPPAPGETVLGTRYSEHGGGKGQNQAIAAAALAPTAFVGALGEDTAGDELWKNLAAHGVDVSRVVRVGGPSGRAFITVTPDGENSIVVIPGASALLTADAVTRALGALRPQVVAAQQEISADAVAAAAAWAQASGARLVLNASPTRPLSPSLLAVADPLIVNAGEARDLVGAAGKEALAEVEDEADLAVRLGRLCRSVIVTAGAHGAFLAGPEGAGHVPAVSVQPVDATGAGDAFAGTVAAGIAVGDTLMEAAARASAAAARVVGSHREDRGAGPV